MTKMLSAQTLGKKGGGRTFGGVLSSKYDTIMIVICVFHFSEKNQASEYGTIMIVVFVICVFHFSEIKSFQFNSIQSTFFAQIALESTSEHVKQKNLDPRPPALAH